MFPIILPAAFLRLKYKNIRISSPFYFGRGYAIIFSFMPWTLCTSFGFFKLGSPFECGMAPSPQVPQSFLHRFSLYFYLLQPRQGLYTQKILDVLADYGVKATFFVVGNWADQYPEQAKAIVDSGCELMNHSILEMSRNVQSGNTQNLKSSAASDQAAVCACARSRYFAGGSPSGLRV